MVVMVGATATHLLHREPQVITTLALLALLTIVCSVRAPWHGCLTTRKMYIQLTATGKSIKDIRLCPLTLQSAPEFMR
jgi:hypothetical protein